VSAVGAPSLDGCAPPLEWPRPEADAVAVGQAPSWFPGQRPGTVGESPSWTVTGREQDRRKREPELVAQARTERRDRRPGKRTEKQDRKGQGDQAEAAGRLPSDPDAPGLPPLVLH
jgi:hypothetical protein